jgi:uncharacterized repeat protein (TIGR03833 family)
MNRPRNRQSRPPRNEAGRGHGAAADSGRSTKNNDARPSYPSFVPKVHQVIPGAGVSIVLKQDQPTGREVQGIVADVLTRGNHPRGIKVRLRDGRVGRVQRMSDGRETAHPETSRGHVQTGVIDQSAGHGHDGRLPARTLADYLPALDNDGSLTGHETLGAGEFSTATAVCPICGNFEGDEVAVSHHVQSHLE